MLQGRLLFITRCINQIPYAHELPPYQNSHQKYRINPIIHSSLKENHYTTKLLVIFKKSLRLWSFNMYTVNLPKIDDKHTSYHIETS